MPSNPKPSSAQREALTDLIDNRPGCHLVPLPTARVLVRHGWVTRRAVRDGQYVETFFDVTAAGYAAVGRPVPAAAEPDTTTTTTATAAAAALEDPAAAGCDKAPADPAPVPHPRRAEWSPGGVATVSRRAAWAMAGRTATARPLVTPEQRAARQAAADASPCATHNATEVEVSLAPLTGAAVHLLCGQCRTSHWSKALDGTYADAAAVPVDAVARLIRRQGVQLAGGFRDHQPTGGGTWSLPTRRARVERIPAG